MGKIIAVYHQKGGVGKTTTAVNLAAAMTILGKKALLCDFDPQGNATSGSGADKTLRPNIYDVMVGKAQVEDILIRRDNMDVLPSNSALSGAAIEIVNEENRSYKLKAILNSLRDSYHYIFIDCPPQFGLLSLNALCAADSVLVPFQCEYYALEGLGDFLKELRSLKKTLNPSLYIEGVVLTMVDWRPRLTMQISKEIQDYFGEKLFKTHIPRNIRLTEAPSHGMDIFQYDNKSKGAKCYMALAEEIYANDSKEAADGR